MYFLFYLCIVFKDLKKIYQGIIDLLNQFCW